MSEQPSLSKRVARAAALICSLTLGGIVVVHAQFGCDAPPNEPAKSDQPAKAGEGAPTPTSVPDAPEAAPSPAAKQPDAPTSVPDAPEAAPAPAPEATAEAAPKAKPEAKEERVYMPASKSAGDFEDLPGRRQITPTSQNNVPRQQANQAPTQQAPQ